MRIAPPANAVYRYSIPESILSLLLCVCFSIILSWPGWFFLITDEAFLIAWASRARPRVLKERFRFPPRSEVDMSIVIQQIDPTLTAQLFSFPVASAESSPSTPSAPGKIFFIALSVVLFHCAMEIFSLDGSLELNRLLSESYASSNRQSFLSKRLPRGQ